MHLTIINASPYGNKYSNTKMIVDTFGKAIAETGNQVSVYSLSDRTEWDCALKSFLVNNNIIFVIPVYLGITPSVFMEFSEQLDSILNEDLKQGLNVSFILQSAFPESSQRVCCEHFLKSLTECMGLNFCGILSHSIYYGLIEKGIFDNLTEAYNYFGKKYVENDFTFFFSDTIAFNGAEYLTEQQAKKFVRGFNFMCRHNAEELGCRKELNGKPFDELLKK